MAIRKDEIEKKEKAIVRDSSGNITKVIDFSNKQVGLPENPKNSTVTGAALGSSRAVSMAAGGRLTLLASTPVATGSIVSASVVYYTPMDSNQITLNNGTFWQQCSFNQPTFQLSSANPADTNYDIFASIGQDDSEIALTGVAWQGSTTRTTSLARLDGVLVSSADPTLRYLGTIRTTSAGVTEDSSTKRLVWNKYNRVRRPMLVKELSSTSWSYTTTVFRISNNNPANRLEVVIGDEGVEFFAFAHSIFGASAGVVAVNGGIGVDSTTTNSANVYGGTNAPGSGIIVSSMCQLRTYLTPGYHQINWLEIGNTNVTFYGTNGAATNYQSGMLGDLLG